MEVPSIDTRSYRHIRLAKNGLCCLLIHDADNSNNKAAAAMAVHVGQMHDTIHASGNNVKYNLPGLAHLTEHLLFMGTEKFPNENEYDKYLSNNGGHSNAYTDLQLTNYYFEVSTGATGNQDGPKEDSEDAPSTENGTSETANETTTTTPKNGMGVLEGALDRFASCFISPLLAAESLEREIQAVDSEHAKNVQSDHWRIDHLTRMILGKGSPTDHPYASFGSGNRESLLGQYDLETLRTAVQMFYNKYYISKNMTLCVFVGGSQWSMDQLEDLVERTFGDIPTEPRAALLVNSLSPDATTTANNDQIVIPSLSDYAKANLPTRVNVVPIREHVTIEMLWPMREVQSLYDSKPTRFLSHLLGHEVRSHEWKTPRLLRIIIP